MKLSTFLTLALFSLLSIKAQELENSTLWKIEGNGLENPSYLFGTIHITCDATLDDDVKNALGVTSQLVLEIDMDDPNMMAQMMGGMYMKDGKTIQDLVSEEEFKIIDAMLIKEAGMSLTTVQTMKPFFIISMLYPKLLDCPMQSFEQKLVEITKAQNEEIFGLETIAAQMQVFEDIPYEDQVADLIRTAKDDLAYDKATFSKMLELYRDEDITAMLGMMDDENNVSVSKHQDKLLNDRNKNWISKIIEYAKDQPTFFGVGAGHLAGEFGVINLLREAGYEISAI